MKKAVLIAAITLFAATAFCQSIGKPKDTTPDTVKRYHFTESDVILIDNLMGQLDQVSGNSDKVSTAQYNQLHRAVLRVDSLIKVQYNKYHPVKEQPKKK